jgi:hypothetical protein
MTACKNENYLEHNFEYVKILMCVLNSENPVTLPDISPCNSKVCTTLVKTEISNLITFIHL